MNSFIYLLALTFFAAPTDDEIDSSQDRIKVEKAVVAWADSTFYSHSEYKFENFRAEYSDDYFIAVMRAKAYQERVIELEQQKAAGRYKGSQENYEAELKTLKETQSKIQKEADNFINRADYYLIHFWSNIQTTDGITVYYEHILKLNNAYNVIEATINSAIGKKDESSLPLYKKDVKIAGGDVKKKVDDGAKEKVVESQLDQQKDNTTTDVPESVTPEEVDTKKKKKEKKKK